MDSAQLYAETFGKGDPFVMIHAGVADSRQWNREFEFFSTSHRVIRYDMRGYGRSEPADGEFNHLRDLLAVLEAVDVDEPAIVMGCSMGAQLALDMAMDHTRRVRALILVGAGLTGLEFEGPESPKFRQAEQAWKDGDIERTAELETQIWFDGEGRTAQQVDPATRQLAVEMNRLALSHASRKLGTRLPNVAVPSANRLSEVVMPVLLIVGAHDQPLISAATEHMLKHIPTARRAVMQDAAHLPNLDHPTVFRGLVKDFLASLPR